MNDLCNEKDTASKRGAVLSQTECMEINIDRLHQAITLVTDVFGSVLRQGSETSCGETPKNPVPPCTMSSIIGKFNSGIEEAIHRLNSLADRCEL